MCVYIYAYLCVCLFVCSLCALMCLIARWSVSGPREIHEFIRDICATWVFNPWSPGGSFMVQKMATTSPIPVFQELMCLVTKHIQNYQEWSLIFCCVAMLIELPRFAVWGNQPQEFGRRCLFYNYMHVLGIRRKWSHTKTALGENGLWDIFRWLIMQLSHINALKINQIDLKICLHNIQFITINM